MVEYSEWNWLKARCYLQIPIKWDLLPCKLELIVWFGVDTSDLLVYVILMDESLKIGLCGFFVK